MPKKKSVKGDKKTADDFDEQSSETDTETEFEMTNNEYLDSISWCIGQVKEKKKTDKDEPTKTAAEVRKRIVVGFMILSWYVSPMYINPLAM